MNALEISQQFERQSKADIAKMMQKGERKILALIMKKLKVPSGIHINPIEDRQGKCYELAGKFVLRNNGWSLCHGFIEPPFGPHMDIEYYHAWAEKGKVVYEAVFNYFFKKEEYYKAYLPQVNKRFNEKKAREAALKYEMWGPW